LQQEAQQQMLLLLLLLAVRRLGFPSWQVRQQQQPILTIWTPPNSDEQCRAAAGCAQERGWLTDAQLGVSGEKWPAQKTRAATCMQWIPVGYIPVMP